VEVEDCRRSYGVAGQDDERPSPATPPSRALRDDDGFGSEQVSEIVEVQFDAHVARDERRTVSTGL
jgi:hypothetical protein